MIDQPAMEIRQLSKTYKVYPKPLDLLRELIFGGKRHSEFAALNSIDLTIRRGEVVGIIGSNGAGKSTLLRIIAGTLDTTAGNVRVNGSLSAILELGTGFQPDYSGRENVIIGGMCLGMTKAEVESKLQSIIDFSELGAVIDQPFKTYSSGMKARLTFSTAMSIEPDILIIDEALATGDAYFVSKCMRRIREICDSGATVMFVSHSSFLVAELCDSAVWIEDGRIVAAGPAGSITKAYEYSIWQRTKTLEPTPDSEALEGNTKQIADVVTTGSYSVDGSRFRISDVKLYCNDVLGTLFHTGDKFSVRLTWEGLAPSGPLWFGIGISSSSKGLLMGYESWTDKRFIMPTIGTNCRGEVLLSIPNLHIGPGEYELSVSVSKFLLPWSPDCTLHRLSPACLFSVRRKNFIPYSAPYDPTVHFDEVKD